MHFLGDHSMVLIRDYLLTQPSTSRSGRAVFASIEHDRQGV